MQIYAHLSTETRPANTRLGTEAAPAHCHCDPAYLLTKHSAFDSINYCFHQLVLVFLSVIVPRLLTPYVALPTKNKTLRKHWACTKQFQTTFKHCSALSHSRTQQTVHDRCIYLHTVSFNRITDNI